MIFVTSQRYPVRSSYVNPYHTRHPGLWDQLLDDCHYSPYHSNHFSDDGLLGSPLQLLLDGDDYAPYGFYTRRKAPTRRVYRRSPYQYEYYIVTRGDETDEKDDTEAAETNKAGKSASCCTPVAATPQTPKATEKRHQEEPVTPVSTPSRKPEAQQESQVPCSDEAKPVQHSDVVKQDEDDSFSLASLFSPDTFVSRSKVEESETEYTFTFNIPSSYDKSDLTLELDTDARQLLLRGNKKNDESGSVQSFVSKRSVAEDADLTSPVKATFENSILTVIVSRSPKGARSQTIQIE